MEKKIVEVCEFCGERPATTSWDCTPACSKCAREALDELVEFAGYGGAADELSSHFDGDLEDILI